MKEKRLFLTSLKQTCNEYLIKFSENQSTPKLENRKTSPCSPCAPNLPHVLLSRIPGYHNLCSPVHDNEKVRFIRNVCSIQNQNDAKSHSRVNWLLNTLLSIIAKWTQIGPNIFTTNYLFFSVCIIIIHQHLLCK